MSDSESERSDDAMSDADDNHELVGGAASEAEDSDAEPPPAAAVHVNESAARLDPSAKLMVPYNKNFYKVPMKDLKSKVQVLEGWVRCYNRKVPVSSAVLLGEMCQKGASVHKAWPKGDELKKLVTADKVIVVNGKFVEMEKEKEKGVQRIKSTIEDCNVWYVLFDVADAPAGTHDDTILRHIPKATYLELVELIKSDPALAESSLLRMYAYADNEKALNPEHNNWVKALPSESPKSAAVPPPKAAARESKSSSKPKESSKNKEEGGKEEGGKEESSKESAKKPSASMESFWRPRSSADAEDESKNPKEPKEPKESKEPKEPKEPKQAKQPKQLKEPKEQEADKGPREEEMQPIAPGSKRVSFGEPRNATEAKDGDKLFKRRRTSVVEEHSFVICEPGISIDFPAPEGATGGTATITWSFD
jgi:hypothetical protein